MIASNLYQIAFRLREASKASAAATGRLRQAAETFAEALIPMLPDDELPRGYESLGGKLVLHWRGLVIALPASDEPHRLALQELARDVSTGWLDELTTWLIARANSDDEAARALMRAATALTAEGMTTPKERRPKDDDGD